MQTTDETLRRSLQPRGDAFMLTLDRAFQGLPDTAHGGTVLAAFDAVAAFPGARRVTGIYRKRVPLLEPLALDIARLDASLTCRLLDATATTLVEGRVEPALLDGDASERPAGAGELLPVSSTCFACGVENPLGLRAQLSFDDLGVWATWRPLERFRAADGTLAPIAVTALLDEVAFWLGALCTGESGMTTDLDVVLGAGVPFGGPITVSGARDRVRPTSPDPRYRATHVIARDEDGRAVAVADITFVAIRGAGRKLAGWMLARNPPDVLRRIFPAYVR